MLKHKRMPFFKYDVLFLCSPFCSQPRALLASYSCWQNDMKKYKQIHGFYTSYFGTISGDQGANLCVRNTPHNLSKHMWFVGDFDCTRARYVNSTIYEYLKYCVLLNNNLPKINLYHEFLDQHQTYHKLCFCFCSQCTVSVRVNPDSADWTLIFCRHVDISS